MSPLDEYRSIVADLEPDRVTALWFAALGGHRVDADLRDRLVALVALRDRMGRASAERYQSPPIAASMTQGES